MINEADVVPNYTPFVEEKKQTFNIIYYSFSFDLLYADIANIKFLAKSTVDPIYCLVFVDFFTSKSYTYPMKKKRNLLAKKIEQFYNDIEKKEI